MIREAYGISLLTLVVLLAGCQTATRPGQDTKDDDRMGAILQVEDAVVSDGLLVLKYKVYNSFPDDIWVCDDIDHKSEKFKVETRVESERILIRLRLDIESNVNPYQPPVGVYYRLAPGMIRREQISLSLPIQNVSPVYDFHERGKPSQVKTLHHGVLEVGFFPNSWIDIFRKMWEKYESTPGEGRPLLEIAKDLHNGELCEVVYASYFQASGEVAVSADFHGVAIPCR